MFCLFYLDTKVFSEVWQHTNPGEIPIVLHEFYVQVMRVPSKDGF